MLNFFILLLTFSIPLFLSPHAPGQSPILDCGDSEPVGYFLTQNHRLQLRTRSFWNQKTKDLSYNKLVEKLEKYALKSNPQVDLALIPLIIDTARITRLDPFLLAALIRKESTFDPTRVSSGYAHGLTQLTGPALNELRNQFGLNPLLPGQGASYFLETSRQFFEQQERHRTRNTSYPLNDPNRPRPQFKFKAYLNWLTWTGQDLAESRKVLKFKNDYALLTVALYFRLLLILNKNNVAKALENYNGQEGHKQHYSDIIRREWNQLMLPVQCQTPELSPATRQSLEDICTLSEDSAFCQDYLGWTST